MRLNFLIRPWHAGLEEQIPVYAISGNHDGAETLAFGRDFFQPQGLHLYTFEEAFKPIELRIGQGLLPFYWILLMLGLKRRTKNANQDSLII